MSVDDVGISWVTTSETTRTDRTSVQSASSAFFTTLGREEFRRRRLPSQIRIRLRLIVGPVGSQDDDNGDVIASGGSQGFDLATARSAAITKQKNYSIRTQGIDFVIVTRRAGGHAHITTTC